jgi:general secretion pathway protein D
MIKPLDTRILCLALTALCAPASFAGSYDGAAVSVDSTAQREIIRRQEDIVVAERLIQQGDRAMAAKDYETAYTSYMQAVDLIGSGPAVKSQRAVALGKFSNAGIAYAQYLIDHGRYSDAEKVAKTILLPEYNPNYGPAVALLSHLEQPDYYNKTVTPQFAEDREQVAKLLSEADGFYARGSYDLATKRYEQVLNIDHYNNAARLGMEKVNNARGQYYREAYNETRSRMLWQVAKGWELPIHHFAHGKDTTGAQSRTEASRTEAITAKLNRIIIPKIDMSDTTIREAIDYLHQLSVKLDTLEPDPAKKGVNIFLKLASSPSGAAGAGGLPGLGNEILPPAAPAAGVGATAAPAAAAPQPTEDTQITLSLSNVPLYEALRYVSSLAGLKIKIDPVAVSIVPLSDVSTELITKEYKVPPNFIPKKTAEAAASTDTAGGAAGGGFGFGVTNDSGGSRIAKQQTAQEYLASLGVQFPEGASAQYIPAGSKLVVRNTQDNIDFIDQVVDSITGSAPTQVQIESKFVEINQNNLKELGFDWTLGAFSVGGGTYMAGGDISTNTTTMPFTEPGQSSPIGSYSLTQGLRTGQGASPHSAVSANSIDSLLSGLNSGAAPGMFGLAGIFTNPQFQVVIRALNQKKGIDLMSAPTVTTKSGIKAVVNVIREFRYPTQFDPPQIPQTVNSGTTTDGGISGGFSVSPIITPTTPSGFDTRNLGVTLEVTPQVGADGYTIDLDLAPEVVDFDGFINYGTPILGLGSSGIGPLAAPTSVIVSPNVINQPIFSSRKVTTNVTIWDGMTISLGGLIREDVQKVQDKVPLLGDVPLVGRLFRSDVDQKIKKNLIIFVTAKLLDAEGKPVRSDVEQEEVVEPLGLPDEIPPPNIEMKGPPAK